MAKQIIVKLCSMEAKRKDRKGHLSTVERRGSEEKIKLITGVDPYKLKNLCI